MAVFSPLATIKRLTTDQPDAPEAAMLGRFELRRILGQGAQSVVWLAFDPRLEREVAIKQMKLDQGTDAATLAQWLQEARSVSRLTHPGIVPVFEADVHEQQPYLVFEYVPGQTLAQLLAQRGALPPAEALVLARDVLDALAAAHSAGVVHRDLKPSNILIDSAGRARVMDFGIAVRIKETSGAQQGSVTFGGTPGYLSPEAAKGLPATPLMDVFSAGLVLTEMLTGQPLVPHTDAYRAIYQVTHEQLVLPPNLGAGVDDRLRAIVLRALALDPDQRHPGAQVFGDVLIQWSGAALPAHGESAQQAVDASNGTLDFLLRRMRHKGDFPALSDSIVRIQGMATSETESVSSVTNEILKDVALTNKLLRLVNSAHFARGGSISTVSRAVTLVGFNGIRNMALSLVLLEHMQDKAHASVLKEEFLRSLMAGTVAGELSSVSRDTEEAFIGAMFQNLGRLLAHFYFPEEAGTIRTLVTSPRQPVSEATASASVLGLNYEALGIGVAKAWGLPEGIQKCMKRPQGPPPTRAPADAGERLRWTALVGNAVADILLHTDPKEVDARLSQVARHYAKTLGVNPSDVQNATFVARKKLVEMADAMDIRVMAGSAASKLLKLPSEALSDHGDAGDTQSDSLVPLELHATQVVAPSSLVSAPAVDTRHVSQTLTSGIQDITNAMVEDFNLSDVLRMVLETMLRAMDFQRIVFCLRDAKTDTLTGRFGLGKDVDTLAKAFHIPLKVTATDLFAAVCLKGADSMISDAAEARISARLPEWYRKRVNAPTFLLLPLAIKGKPFGLIYADKAEKGGLVLDEKELALLRTLRNQAVMAFKQSN
jgi:serine/threonine protein kinase